LRELRIHDHARVEHVDRHGGWMLFKIGIVFVVVTFIFGELITPRTAPLAERLKLSAGRHGVAEFRSGMWTKDIVAAEGMTGRSPARAFSMCARSGRTAS
jgi:hypothetical protein